MDISKVFLGHKVSFSESDASAKITPPLLSFVILTLMCLVGLVFLFAGGLKALIGVSILFFAASNAQSMSIVTVNSTEVSSKPFFEKLPMRAPVVKIDLEQEREASVSKRDMNGQFSFSPLFGTVLWPLNSEEILIKYADKTFSLGYFPPSNAQDTLVKFSRSTNLPVS